MLNLNLLAAIAAEIFATSALARTEGFTRALPSALSLGGYAVAFVFLARALQDIPVGVAYAMWSGLGVVGITLIAAVLYGQRLDLPALGGIALIVAGVIVLNLYSDSGLH